MLGFAAAGVSRDEDAVPSTAELYALYVHPDHWGSGYGYGLHSAAMSELAADHTVATLWVLETNARGRRFYERQGWCPDGTRKQEVHGAAVLDELRYRLDLGRGA